MKNGTPVIYSAPVKNEHNNTRGVIDLLVRSDYIDHIIKDSPLTDDEKYISAPNLNGNYHYVVIDIKYSTLPLRSDQRHLLNTGNYPAYKSQLWIYNQAISHIQGYLPKYSFILGRRNKFTTKGITNIQYNCLSKLGVIDFENVDKEYNFLTKKAIKWVRDVKKYGKNWTTNPPSRKELYPNMCIDSGIWNTQKEKISSEIHEITSIWNCGIKNRNIAISNNIKSWKDPNCISRNIGIYGKKAIIVDKILKINRQNKDKVLPKKLKTDISKTGEELFVDFETLSDICPDFTSIPEQPVKTIIFMIGIGFIKNNKWNYRNFICNEATPEEEFRIMNEFVSFVKEKQNPTLYFWHAENFIWNSAERRQTDISNNWKNLQWVDLCSLFKTEPITVKDSFDFGLKNIAKSMKKHKLISTSYNESNCKSGLSASNRAWNWYNKRENETDMKDIEKYNEYDCKVLWEILEYLRKNHT